MGKKNLIKTFLIPLFIALIFPFMVIYIMGPSVKAIVVEDGKKDALRLAGHLKNILALESNAPGEMSEVLKGEAESLARQFNLYKLSILSANGKVVFSTDKDDAGFIDKRENFKEIISRGNGYAVYKEKGTKSEEGRVLNSDVIETYAPIIKDGVVTGAIEIYYDITETREDFRQVEKAFSMIFFVVAFIGLAAITAATIKAEKERRMKTEAEKELRLFSTAIEETMDGVQIVNLNGCIIYSNKAIEEIYGFTAQELAGKHVNDMNVDETFADKVILPSIMSDGRWDGEIRVRHKNGKVFTVWLTASIVRNSEGIPIAMIGIIRDITDKKAMEMRLYEYQQRLEDAIESRTQELRTVSEQLHQSRKMEAIGQLAGGIAHDFNNRLAAIMNYCSILDKKLGKADPMSAYVGNMMASLDKAAGLTKSLLAFSSKQLMHIKPVGLNGIIKGLGVLLGRTLGEDIELRTALSEKDVIVLADANQIENVLINLATNARDAMPGGGVLTIGTRMAGKDEINNEKWSFGPKAFATVSVTDTGTGIEEDIRERIFEPFFTTKEYGKGTGLGLSTVYGILKQHGGGIDLVSRPGHGTTFKIYLPVAASAAAERPAEQVDTVGGSETILLVEDDSDVRNSLKELLEGFGYKVLDAGDGEEAIEIFEKRKKDIQLLILDIIMPGMNGKAVYEMAKISKPGIKAIFTSGYTSDILGSKGITDGDISFIAKPVSKDTLLGKIREVMTF